MRQGSRIAQRSDGSRAIGGLVWRPCRASSARIAPGAGPCRRSSEKSSKALLYKKPPLPIAALYRQVVRFAQNLGERTPSYGTVFNIVRRLGADLVLLAHEGPKAYSETFELVYRREAAGPNAIWQADHTPLDIWLIRPDGQTGKPWLTVVIDDYSRAVAGYFLSFEAPCALHTSLALRQAIWRKEDARWMVCGIPEVLYTDHGSDFTSRHLEQVSADLKTQLVFSLPANPAAAAASNASSPRLTRCSCASWTATLQRAARRGASQP